MPTGYTDAVRTGCTFERFVWSCARAFGALVAMRDCSSGATIPEAFEPSSWHADHLREAETELSRCLDWTSEQAEAEAAVRYAEQLQRHREHICKNATTEERYRTMLGRVMEWDPPTADHDGLRKFMIEQLISSIDFDCGYRIPEPVRLSGEEYRTQRLAELRRDIAYHRDEHAKELTRTAERNSWLAALRESVPMPTAEEKDGGE